MRSSFSKKYVHDYAKTSMLNYFSPETNLYIRYEGLKLCRLKNFVFRSNLTCHILVVLEKTDDLIHKMINWL